MERSKILDVTPTSLFVCTSHRPHIGLMRGLLPLKATHNSPLITRSEVVCAIPHIRHPLSKSSQNCASRDCGACRCTTAAGAPCKARWSLAVPAARDMVTRTAFSVSHSIQTTATFSSLEAGTALYRRACQWQTSNFAENRALRWNCVRVTCCPQTLWHGGPGTPIPRYQVTLGHGSATRLTVSTAARLSAIA